MLRAIRGRNGPDTGASAVEYGLLIFAITAVIVAIVFLFGRQVLDLFTSSCSNLYATTCN